MPRFGRIPSQKATLLWLALRYGFIDKSILVTEGLAPHRFHSVIVILVDEHTSQCRRDGRRRRFHPGERPRTIVGTKTAGRLVSGSAFKAGFGYMLGLPVAAYLTWEGKLIEGKGVAPVVNVEMRPEHLLAGEDPQMEQALQFLREI